MQLPLFFVVGVATLALCLTLGFRTAVRVIYIPVLLLVPVWLRETRFASVVLDLRLVVACGVLPGLVLFLLRQRPRILLADILVAGLVAAKFASMYLAGEVRLLTGFEIMRQILLPYLMGRWCLASGKDVNRYLPLMMMACLLMGIWSIFEAVTKINPVLKLPMAPYFPLLAGDEGFRWGLKRAQGPLEHPIFWGLVLAMVLPWAMAAAHRVWNKRGPLWWLLIPGLLLAAIVVTVSRGAMIAAILTVGVGIVLRWRRLRVPVLVVALAVGSALWASKDTLIPKLTALIQTKEDQVEEPTILIINGREEVYTGDRHRILLRKVYKKFIDQAGWLGFGDDIQTSVTGRIGDEDLRMTFHSIDNHYLQFYLMHGRLGLGLFAALEICVLVYLLRASWNLNAPESALAGWMFAAMAGMGIVLWSVWFADDFAAVWLFFAGMAGCLRASPSPSGPQATTPSPRQSPRPTKPPKLNILKPPTQEIGREASV